MIGRSYYWFGIVGCWLLVCFEICHAEVERSSTVANNNNNNNNNSQLWKDWLYARSGGRKGMAVWSYEGRLVDPRTGLTIAQVEGLELVRRLAQADNNHLLPNNSKHNYLDRVKKRWDSLVVKDMLLPKANNKNNNDNSNHWNYANSILSRKLFCYVDDNSNNNNNNDDQNKKMLLRKIRPFGNPSRPWIYIPAEQAVSLVDSAITYISSPNSAMSNGNGNEEDWIVHTEWADGKYITCPTTCLKSSSSDQNRNLQQQKQQQQKLLQFAVQMPSTVSKQHPPPKLSSILPNRQKSNNTNQKQKRSTLIQFGRSPTNDSSSPVLMPARETYLYQWNDDASNELNINNNDNHNHNFLISTKTMIQQIGNRLLFFNKGNSMNKKKNNNNIDNSQMTMFYTRQGEAPPWYGPGQSVILELVGKQYTSLSDAPWNTVARLAARSIPGFATVLTPLPDITTNNKDKDGKNIISTQEQKDSDDMAARAVRWFRQGDSKNKFNNNGSANNNLKLQIMWDNDDELFGNDMVHSSLSNRPKKVIYTMRKYIDKIVAATKLSSDEIL